MASWRHLTLIAAHLVLFALLGTACTSRPVLYDVGLEPATISPNGSGIRDETKLRYSLATRADVRVSLLGAAGFNETIREYTRATGNYEVRFTGAVGTETHRRVVPDGAYTFVIEATDGAGRKTEQRVALKVEDADTAPPEVANVVANLPVISPNGDGIDDEATVSFAMSKKAFVTFFLTNERGDYYLLYAPQRKEGLQAFLFDGHDVNKKLLPDGKYTFHVQTWDKAGNLSEATGPIGIEQGGEPRLEIMDAKFSPTSIPLGGKVQVRINVKNVGDAIIRSDPADGVGPAPGTAYTTDQSFASWQSEDKTPLYYERPGTFRVGVSWTNAPPPPVPVRWSLGKDLAPGEETIVTGEVQVLQRTRELYFSAWVVQEGIGFPGGARAQTLVKISY